MVNLGAENGFQFEANKLVLRLSAKTADKWEFHSPLKNFGNFILVYLGFYIRVLHFTQKGHIYHFTKMQRKKPGVKKAKAREFVQKVIHILLSTGENSG